MKVGIRKGFINGIGFGATVFIMYGSYALAFWYGSSLVRAEEYSAGQLITVSNVMQVLHSSRRELAVRSDSKLEILGAACTRSLTPPML